MKGKKHKPEQIIRKLREGDAMLSADTTIGQVSQPDAPPGADLRDSLRRQQRWNDLAAVFAVDAEVAVERQHGTIRM